MSHVFRGSTLIEARRAAEKKLGGEVVVLHTRRVKKKGVAGALGATEFEITAGVRVQDEELDEAAEATLPQRKMHFAAGAYDEEAVKPRRDVQDMAKLSAEVRAMRGMIHSLSRSPTKIQAEISTLRRAVDGIVPSSPSARLELLISRSGLEGPVAEEVRRELGVHKGDNASLLDAYRDALADRIRVRSWPLASDTRKVVAVVGAPGVGKTTTAAKIAARAVSEGRTVRFITCDTYRVGAVEQIQRYATLLEVPLEVAKTAEALHEAISAATEDIVIVDTSGRGPRDDESVEAALARDRTWGDRARHVLLCLEASTRYADTEHLVKRFRLCAPTALAVTKIDLASRPAGLINGTILTDIAVSVLCDGQRVPEDLSPATAGRILDHIAPHKWANSSRFQN